MCKDPMGPLAPPDPQSITPLGVFGGSQRTARWTTGSQKDYTAWQAMSRPGPEILRETPNTSQEPPANTHPKTRTVAETLHARPFYTICKLYTKYKSH